MEEYLERQRAKWKRESTQNEENDVKEEDSIEEIVRDCSDPKPDILEEDEEEDEECEGEGEDEKYPNEDWKEQQERKWRIQEEEEKKRRLEMEKEREEQMKQQEREEQMKKDELYAHQMFEKMKKEEEEREKQEKQEIRDFEMALKLQKEYIDENKEQVQNSNRNNYESTDKVVHPRNKKKKEEEEEEKMDKAEDHPQVVDQLIGGNTDPDSIHPSVMLERLLGRINSPITESERQEREDRELAMRLQREYINENQESHTHPHQREPRIDSRRRNSVMTFTTPSGSFMRTRVGGSDSDSDDGTSFDDMFRSMFRGRMRIPVMMRSSNGRRRRRNSVDNEDDDFFGFSSFF